MLLKQERAGEDRRGGKKRRRGECSSESWMSESNASV